MYRYIKNFIKTMGAVVRVVHFPFHLAKELGVKISELATTIICESSEIWLTMDLVDRERLRRFVYFLSQLCSMIVLK